MRRGYNVKDVDSDVFIKKYAQHLKKSGKITVPEWTEVVKTGVANELSPVDPDWFYVRAAALARRLYIQPEGGVGRLRKRYGKKNNRRGSKPSHKSKASGKIIRVILQQLEKSEILEKVKDNGPRRVSSKGRRDMDIIANQIKHN